MKRKPKEHQKYFGEVSNRTAGQVDQIQQLKLRSVDGQTWTRGKVVAAAVEFYLLHLQERAQPNATEEKRRMLQTAKQRLAKAGAL